MLPDEEGLDLRLRVWDLRFRVKGLRGPNFDVSDSC